MTFILALAVIALVILLAAILVAKSRGTDLAGLLKIDIGKYTKLVDKVK